MKKIVKPLVIVLVLAAVLFGLRQLPVAQWIAQLEELVKEQGNLGYLIYFAAYIVACVALLPGSALTLLAGVLWGPVLGTAVVSVSSVAGATVAFLVGRYGARNRVDRQLEKQPKFKSVGEALGQDGFKLVMLLRLSPVFPFNLLNYMMGVTKVSLKDYVLASWIGMLPGTAMYVYFGFVGKEAAAAAASGGVDTGKTALTVAGLVATVLVTVLVTKKAKAALADFETKAVDAED